MSESPFSDEFLGLLARFQGRFFGYLYSLLHNLDDAEDVLQEAILAMWRRFGEFDRQRSFVNWGLRFAELSALNHLRSKRRRRVIFSNELVHEITESYSLTGSEEGDPFECYHDALLQCMDRLPPADRDLIRLCYYEKCSIKRVAERLGRSPQSVCNSLRRIRMALFDCIQAAQPPEGKGGQAPFVRSTQRAVPAKGACPPFPEEGAP